MAGPADILRELHRLRRHSRNLQDELERLPRQIKVLETKAARQEEALRKCQESAKLLKVKIHDKETTLKANHLQIGKLEKQRNEATGKKEYDGLNLELSTTRLANQKLENEIVDVMEKVEEEAARAVELEKQLKQVKTDVAQFGKTSQERRATLTAELEKTKSLTDEVEAKLTDDVRSQYNRLVSQRAEDALAVVQDRTCGACYTGITAQSYNELLQGFLVFCKSCGRVLYLPE